MKKMIATLAAAAAVAKADLYYGEATMSQAGGSASSLAVTFADADGVAISRADANYFVLMNIEGSSIDPKRAFASSKTTLGFTINLNPALDTGQSCKVQYLVVGSGA